MSISSGARSKTSSKRHSAYLDLHLTTRQRTSCPGNVFCTKMIKGPFSVGMRAMPFPPKAISSIRNSSGWFFLNLRSRPTDANVVSCERYLALMFESARFFSTGLRSATLLAFSLVACVTSAQEKNELSVVTFNVRYANPEDTLRWEDRKDEVVNAVRYFDIVGFQEVLPIQKEDLIARMPRHGNFGQGRNRDGGGEACPIFWNQERFDFLHGEVRWFSDNPNEPGSVDSNADLPRIVTIVLLYDLQTEKTIRVMNTHWSHASEEARLVASNMLAGWTGWSRKADLTLVCGDFNAEPESAPITQLLESSGLKDTFKDANFKCREALGTYTTFFSENFKGAPRIDAIFYRGDATVDWVCADEAMKYGVYISDHLAYHAIFKF